MPENRRKLPPEEDRFKPGQSGNPGGRPRGPSLTRVAIALLIGADVSEFPPTLVKVARALIDKCCEGDARHIAMTWDRLDGKVPDRLEAIETVIWKRDADE